MRSHRIIITLLVALLVTCRLQGNCADFITSINTEILRDFLNYDDEQKRLLGRSFFSHSINERYFFNLFLIRDFSKDNTSWTWNLSFSEVENSFDFVMGNYNLRFGSGVVFGKKILFSGDPFDRSFSISKDKRIITSTGTNPAGSLFGITSDVYFKGDDITSGIVPFFSIQRRYIKEEEISMKAITSGLQTLNSKTDKEGAYSSPVNIFTCGTMAYLNFAELLKIHLYYSQTEVRDVTMNRIKWEYNNTTGDGIEKYSITGLFIEYCDENISLFIEPALSVREFSRASRGYGLIWGCGVRNSIVYLNIRGKNCNEEFFTEYSNSAVNPSNIFEIKSGFILREKYEFGASIFNEKNLNPSYQRDYISGTRKEEIFFNAKPLKVISFDIKAARSSSYKDDLRLQKNKFSATTTISPLSYLFFKLKGEIQEMEGARSHANLYEIKFLFLQNFSLMLGASFINIDGENYMYVAIPPVSEADMATDIFKESTQAYGVKLKYRAEAISFHIRGQYLKSDSGRELTAEFSLGLVF